MKRLINALYTVLFIFYAAHSFAEEIKNDLILNAQNNTWFKQAAKRTQAQDAKARIPPKPRGDAKNIILFVGDGMGVSTVTAARILDGQLKGLLGEENVLSFEHFEHTALSKTYNVDAQTPDSAGTMTAMMSGVKTDAGVIGLAEGVQRGVCSSRHNQSLFSILELAELAGKSTGIVTTSRVTHATPAATYAESVDRNWESSGSLPKDALNAGCEDIAAQLLSFPDRLNLKAGTRENHQVDVVFGGGRRNFLPLTPTFAGTRTDKRNLIEEWKKANPQGRYIETAKQLKKLDTHSKAQVLGLFSASHMNFNSENMNQPSLSTMTEKAIEMLKNNSNGFFLMVEGARIDHAHHAGNAYNALHDTIELSRAVTTAVNNVSLNDTLIIVTADHSHVFTIAGYPKRGNPILGKVIDIGQSTPSLSSAGLPYTTLGYANGPGAYRGGSTSNHHTDIRKIDTEKPNYHQDAHIPLRSETHGAEDVAVYATGPGSHLVAGTLEQNRIFHIMEFAGDLLNKAKNAQNLSD